MSAAPRRRDLTREVTVDHQLTALAAQASGESLSTIVIALITLVATLGALYVLSRH